MLISRISVAADFWTIFQTNLWYYMCATILGSSPLEMNGFRTAIFVYLASGAFRMRKMPNNYRYIKHWILSIQMDDISDIKCSRRTYNEQGAVVVCSPLVAAMPKCMVRPLKFRKMIEKSFKNQPIIWETDQHTVSVQCM